MAKKKADTSFPFGNLAPPSLSKAASNPWAGMSKLAKPTRRKKSGGKQPKGGGS
jgi:hypothetical protein